MKTCAACRYFSAYPNQPAPGAEHGACFGRPPQNMLIPVSAPEPQRVMKPGAQQMQMTLQSMRPTVTANDRSCSLFRDLTEH